uniref:hypothetical protein n=1 Tax=Klebsiella pneumoniae TaxID=573 RepID=UPI00254CEE57
MAPRKRRTENIGLPSRWCFQHGAYYFQVPLSIRHHWDGKAFFRLGATLAEAHATFASRIRESERDGVVRTVGD